MQRGVIIMRGRLYQNKTQGGGGRKAEGLNVHFFIFLQKINSIIDKISPHSDDPDVQVFYSEIESAKTYDQYRYKQPQK